MTKVEYLKKQKALAEEMEILKEIYINDNKKGNIGDKVEIWYNNKIELGEIVGHCIGGKYRSFGDDVVPIVCKLKKDGTRSANEITLWRDSKITYL